jgi:hypothetical protein
VRGPRVLLPRAQALQLEVGAALRLAQLAHLGESRYREPLQRAGREPVESR